MVKPKRWQLSNLHRKQREILAGQVGLRQPAGLAGPGQKGPEIFGVHTVHILWGQDSIPGSKTQPTLRLPALERKNPRRVLGQ